jgi:hypothetical protein
MCRLLLILLVALEAPAGPLIRQPLDAEFCRHFMPPNFYGFTPPETNDDEPVNLISDGDVKYYEKAARKHLTNSRLTALGGGIKNDQCNGDYEPVWLGV